MEVHFKNTRRGYYRNSAHLDLKQGDVVAVEANPGHDIGTVALTGNLVKLQMKRTRLRPDAEILRVFRKAKPADLERFEQAKAKEIDTMIRSRKIAKDLGLEMKIGDVEYQGDGNKAIFYYIADGRVDFRQLIKVLADVFKIRVEMKQIGARQEAGRIGGIGPCGRPLCCASWMSTFVSVATSAARYQEVSLNLRSLLDNAQSSSAASTLRSIPTSRPQSRCLNERWCSRPKTRPTTISRPISLSEKCLILPRKACQPTW